MSQDVYSAFSDHGLPYANRWPMIPHGVRRSVKMMLAIHGRGKGKEGEELGYR
jgi:hypothetical protein